MARPLKPRSDRLSTGRLALLAAGTAAALWITLGATATMVAGAHPAIPGLGWGWGADGDAERGVAALGDRPSPAQIKAARRFSERALTRSAVSVNAVRTLGLAADASGDTGQATRSFAYAERLSRRDLLTEIWMIERSVAAGRIDRALIHYDRALRTRADAGALLYPVLVGAAADPTIARQLATKIAERPLWWPEFVDALLADPKAIGAVPIIFQALNPEIGTEQGRGFVLTAIQRLIGAGRYAAALTIYRRALHRQGAEPLLRDGDFAGDRQLPPFDWQIASDGDLIGDVQDRGGDAALFMTAANGASGEIARQMLLLTPGRYRLTAIAGDTGAADAAPSISVACATAPGSDIARQTIAGAPVAGRRVALDFAVSSGCAAQWLIVSARSRDGDASERQPWIDRIAVKPVR